MIILKSEKVFNIKDSQIKFYFGASPAETFTALTDLSIDELISELFTNHSISLTLDADDTDKLVFTKTDLVQVQIINVGGGNILSDMLGFTTIFDPIIASVDSINELSPGSIISRFIGAVRLPFYLSLANTAMRGGFNLGTPRSWGSGKSEITMSDVYSTPYMKRRGVRNRYTITKERLIELDTFLAYARHAVFEWINTSFIITKYKILINENDNIVNKVDYLRIEQVDLIMIEERLPREV